MIDNNRQQAGSPEEGESQAPIVLLGGGYLGLLKHSPDRAGFELTRAVAQVWSPCALRSALGKGLWGKSIRCLTPQEPETCDVGTFSMQGWWISTALATLISPPGCEVPAFKGKSVKASLAKFEVGGPKRGVNEN